jgi:hypothetical protein
VGYIAAGGEYTYMCEVLGDIESRIDEVEVVGE